MEFNMPSGDKLIYLETGGKNLVFLPNRKQYAELTKESTGIDVRSMMTPDQIVSQVKNMKGVERVGEEKYGDRDAIKYHYSAITDTKIDSRTTSRPNRLFMSIKRRACRFIRKRTRSSGRKRIRAFRA